MNQNVAILRTGRKFDQVLEGARSVFMADGFEGASVDEIARVAGVSKATLYSYFPDKRLLFMEVARSECARYAAQQLDVPQGSSPEMVLTKLARQKISVLLSDFGRRIFRIFLAEIDRFPDLGRQYFESGPLVEHAKLKAYFREAAVRGELDIDDLDMATELWMALVRAELFPRVIFNVIDDVSDEKLDRLVDGCVQMFMARYGARRPS